MLLIIKRITHQRDVDRNVALVHRTHYWIIVKACERDGAGERDGQCGKCYIFVARCPGCRAGFRVTTTI